ncbi:MAG: OmpA family protein [Deltaproteobacteria bacterium]|jgi:outer membrane protein OmpA-like peptidoglycan-associated protein|nr:OmpA family protein [Deltaproteobacteria bacterium]
MIPLLLTTLWVGAPDGSLVAEPVLAPGDQMLEIGVATGAFLPAADHELYDSQTTRQSEFRTFGMSLQLRAAYFPLRFVGAEVEGGFMPQKNSRGENAQLFNIRGHVVAQLPFRVTPFLLAGGGFLVASQDGHGDADRALHWGGGLKFWLSDWMSIRLDGRQVISAAAGPGAGNTSHFEATAGITFTLFREDEDPAMPEELLVVAPPTPQPVEANRAIRIEVESAAQLIVEALDQVYFAFDSANLGPHSLPPLDRAVDLMLRYPTLKVRITGYADSIGPERYNLTLSRRRAEAIEAYLEGHGIAPDRALLEAYGEARPVAPNDTVLGRALNRRCEFNVYEDKIPKIATRSEVE